MALSMKSGTYRSPHNCARDFRDFLGRFSRVLFDAFDTGYSEASQLSQTVSTEQ